MLAQSSCVCVYIYIYIYMYYVCVCVHVCMLVIMQHVQHARESLYMFLMRDEKEERKKQARSNKQTRQRNTAHTRQSLFLEKMSCLGWDSNPRHSTRTCTCTAGCFYACLQPRKLVYVYTCSAALTTEQCVSALESVAGSARLPSTACSCSTTAEPRRTAVLCQPGHWGVPPPGPS